MFPRIALSDPDDGHLIIAALSAHGHAQITYLSERADMYAAVGKDAEQTICLTTMIGMTERVTGLLTAIGEELARLEIERKSEDATPEAPQGD